ncbi:hypothetical protein PLESTB_000198200 [Pleodorina starrii]|uniref:Protein kinase domain-containing protein n=1 Tax=Pleodorina starrii TaxID=330485 RepID=A0A9W6EXS3_9CHLO|nr:hypothetical protein PLESTM_000333600 [Pleodorina starrii]GLC49243.1 hypothetical protein PLESTB_000198200 [Pleodorina starrii]GLC73504.1 hypothetical protein PLESTF_001384800 [Pleodorina starrii]
MPGCELPRDEETGLANGNVGKGQSTEDLARSLFASKDHAMAGLVRELQTRTRRAKESDPAAAADMVAEQQTVERRGLDDQPRKLRPQAEKSDLWVVGGGSTVLGDGTYQQGAHNGAKERPRGGKAEVPQAHPAVPTQIGINVGNGQAAAAAAATTASSRKPLPERCIGRGVLGAWNTCKDIASTVQLHPISTLAAPLAVYVLLAGLGVWGVLAGSQTYMQQRRDDARSKAVDAATGFQIQLEQTYTPGITFSLLVRQHPEWPYWLENFNSTAAELLSRTPAGALWNLQLQPFGQLMAIHPMRPSDEPLVNPPQDQLADPARRESVLTAISSRQPQIAGPLTLRQGFMGALIRYPIFVPDRDAEETFGFLYRENATAIPYSQLPASVRNCSVCYNATSREKWWGLLTLVINYEAVMQGDDAYLATLRKQGFYYSLVRPLNATDEQLIYASGPSSLRDTDAVTVEVKALNSVWLLRVVPSDGFAPSWTVPLVVAVLLMALLVSALLLVAISSLKRARMLLEETRAANRNLAEAMKRLEEEKERMDVLLVRQYDLLRCLDANGRVRKPRGDDDGEHSVGASKRRMMARIEDARRCLDAAKSSTENPIQLFEVLGEGAFGKVQRGLWRGTVVAVKTMILPANMTGQEKREKMAVMEAAISSSLVHPNIVTTYTYFIRPYHEPTHSSVQQMLPASAQPSYSSTTKAFGPEPSFVPEDDSLSTGESTVHSYEVRLVLEFCDKGSLKDALDQHAFMQGNAFNLGAMLETASDIAKAMVHMHAANVLHSDLKARNIMLKSSGTEGRGVIAKVADFGLSTRMEHTETHLSSCFQGTLTHMAPEVMLEGRISKAADVYSFGILMWELFCAGDPFSGVPRAHLGHAITKECRRPKFPPFAPRDYVALAARCWDPDAAARPTFEQVLSELVRMREELGGGESQPLQIIPPAPLPRTFSRSRSDSTTASHAITSSATRVGGGGSSAAGAAGGLRFLQVPLHLRHAAGHGAHGGGGVATARVLLMRSMSANAASVSPSPFALYGSGIQVGGSGSGGGSGGGGGGGSIYNGSGGSASLSSADSEATAAAVTRLTLAGLQGCGSGSGVLGRSASERATRAQRERLRALLLERQMRKLGLRMNSRTGSGPASQLPVLNEEEAEHRCTGGGGGGSE